MKKRVCAYCRVSTDSSDQQSSFESQKIYFEERIKANIDWELGDIYSDEGISGTSIDKREGFKNMIRDAEDGKFDLLLTKEISRFARNTIDAIQYTRLLSKMGIGVFFINDNINTLDKDGEVRLTIMSSLAQDESRKTSERVKWGQKRRMEQGIVFGRELLGYNLENGILSVNEDEKGIIKIIFHKFLNEGKGTHIIARELYEASIKTKRHKERWSATMILKVLKNEKYVGDLTQKKTITPDYLDHKKKYNNGKEEMVYLKDHHEAIIDRKMWEDTQLELKNRTPSNEQKSKYSNRYWCSGKLVCGTCGSRFISRTKNLKNGQVYKAWRCNVAANYGIKKIDHNGDVVGCDSGSINHIALGCVVNYVLKIIDSNKEQIISDLVHDIKELSKYKKIKNTDSLVNKINTLNSKKLKIINYMVEGTLSKQDMMLVNQKYDAEIQSIQNEIKVIEEVNLTSSKQADNLQSYIDRIKTIVNEMEEVDMEEVYKKMISKIIVHQNKILELYLTCIPSPIRIQYECIGRNGSYNTNCRIVE